MGFEPTHHPRSWETPFYQIDSCKQQSARSEYTSTYALFVGESATDPCYAYSKYGMHHALSKASHPLRDGFGARSPRSHATTVAHLALQNYCFLTKYEK